MNGVIVLRHGELPVPQLLEKFWNSNQERKVFWSVSVYTKHYKWSGTSWTSVSALPYNFYGGSAVVYNNEIHILGSADDSTRDTNHYKIDTGESILTLTDSAIKEASILDIYVSQYGVSPTSVTSEVGSVTLTFGKLDNDLNVKVVIM